MYSRERPDFPERDAFYILPGIVRRIFTCSPLHQNLNSTRPLLSGRGIHIIERGEIILGFHEI